MYLNGMINNLTGLNMIVLCYFLYGSGLFFILFVQPKQITISSFRPAIFYYTNMRYILLVWHDVDEYNIQYLLFLFEKCFV